MHTNLIVSIIVAVSLIICPSAAVFCGREVEVTSALPIEVDYGDTQSNISVMSLSTGEINEVEMREYLIGCVAAEMPAKYHSEALKAQAVACYTYAKKTLEQNKTSKPLYADADITDSPDTHQGYINSDDRKEKWGEKSEEYEKKISSAVDEVLGMFMSYKGETVLAVYHSISAGTTQNAESLWGVEIPYLIGVESGGDRLSPDYISVAEFSRKEFFELCEECGAKPDEEDDIGEIKRDENGYALSVVLCGKEVSATKFREVFSLKSNCFEIKYADEKYIITCKGYGHGAGMSQYGADYMARQGFSWREILKHYYTGVEIESE